MKTCKTCGEEKPLEAFRKGNKNADGRRPVCKACMNKTGRTQEQLNAERNRKSKLRKANEKLAKVAKLVSYDTRAFIVDEKGSAVHGKKCSICATYKSIADDFGESTEKRNGKQRTKPDAKCKSCKGEKWKVYAKNNRDKIRPSEKLKEMRRRAYKKSLPDTLTKEQLNELKAQPCALTGATEDIHLDHFIALSTGHGGTYAANIIPLRADLNLSKSDRNPFEWFKEIDAEPSRITALVEYLAQLNDMTASEYEDYVNYCYDNKMEIKRA